MLLLLLSLAACDVVAPANSRTPAPVAGGPTLAPAAAELGAAEGGAVLPAASPAQVFATPTVAPTPDPARTLDVLHRGPVVTLDPGYATSPDDLRITRLLFDGLVQFKPNSQEIAPALAERWQMAADGLSWTFHLREGVVFHDGSPLNADAVLFSYRRLIDEANPYYGVGGKRSPFEQLLGGEIRALRKLDAQTVRLDLRRRFGPLLFYLASHAGGIVSPTAVGKWHSDFRRNPVGTGPYQLRRIEPGKVLVVANGRFWGDAPRLEAISFRQLGDAEQQLAALQESGAQAQALAGADPAQLAALASDPRFTPLSAPGANLSWALLNPALAAPLADLRVRRAIQHAVDVDALVARHWGVAATRAINPYPEQMPCWNRLVRPYAYDPKLAQALLAEAGYAEGFTLTLDYAATPRPYLPDPAGVARSLAADLGAVGISVTLQERPWQELTGLADQRQLAFHLLGGYAMPEPDLFMRKLLLEEPYAQGDFGPAMVELADKALQSYDAAERCAAYQQMQQIFHDTAERIPLAHAQYIDAVARTIEGYVLDADGVQNLRGVALRQN